MDRVPAGGTRLSRLNGARGKRTTVRVIEYTVVTAALRAGGVGEESSGPFCLITTPLEAGPAPAREPAGPYTARRTSETIYRHIRTGQRGGRTATLRSMSPAVAGREPWAMPRVCQALHRMAAETAHRAHPPVSHIGLGRTLAAARRSVGAGFPPRRPAAKVRDVRAGPVREAVRPRPGRAAPRAARRGGGCRTPRPGEPATTHVTRVGNTDRLRRPSSAPAYLPHQCRRAGTFDSTQPDPDWTTLARAENNPHQGVSVTTATHSQKSRRPFYVLIGVSLSVLVTFGIHYHAEAALPSGRVLGTALGPTEEAARNAAMADAQSKCGPGKPIPEVGSHVYETGGEWAAWYLTDCGGSAPAPDAAPCDSFRQVVAAGLEAGSIRSNFDVDLLNKCNNIENHIRNGGDPADLVTELKKSIQQAESNGFVSREDADKLVAATEAILDAA